MSFKELQIFDKVTSWPQLISTFWLYLPVCNVASDWPRAFLHPRCFCLAKNYIHVSSQEYYKVATAQNNFVALNFSKFDSHLLFMASTKDNYYYFHINLVWYGTDLMQHRTCEECSREYE